MNLQSIAGIYQLIARRRGAASWVRKHSNETPEKAEYDAGLLEKEAAALEANARSSEDLINAMEIIINQMQHSEFKSAHLMLAMRDLESASMRLRRELGDQPTD